MNRITHMKDVRWALRFMPRRLTVADYWGEDEKFLLYSRKHPTYFYQFNFFFVKNYEKLRERYWAGHIRLTHFIIAQFITDIRHISGKDNVFADALYCLDE